MALNAQNRLAVFRTAGEAFAITWVLPKPYLVLVVGLMLPWAVISALGLFDPLHAYMEIAAGGDEQLALEDFPLGAMLLSYIYGYLIVVVFGVFWYRYVLLGPGGALKVGLAQLNGMLWRSTGYGLVVLVIYFLFVVVFSVVFTALASFIGMFFDTSSEVPIAIFTAISLLALCSLPLALLARLSLPFPAFALGERLSMAKSWSWTRGSAWRMVGALLTAGLPVSLIVYALYLAMFYSLFRLNPLLPEHAAEALEYWWFSLLMSPAFFLPIALCFAVVALAYRDLARSSASEVPDARSAR